MKTAYIYSVIGDSKALQELAGRIAESFRIRSNECYSKLQEPEKSSFPEAVIVDYLRHAINGPIGGDIRQVLIQGPNEDCPPISQFETHKKGFGNLPPNHLKPTAFGPYSVRNFKITQLVTQTVKEAAFEWLKDELDEIQDVDEIANGLLTEIKLALNLISIQAEIRRTEIKLNSKKYEQHANF